MVIVYRVDGDGQCQAINAPTAQHVRRLVDADNLDQVLYHPVNVAPSHGRFTVHLSLTRPTMIIAFRGRVPDTAELLSLYRWCLEHRQQWAHRPLRLDQLRPARNESHVDASRVAEWCEDHRDAFTTFRCRCLLQSRSPPRKKPRP